MNKIFVSCMLGFLVTIIMGGSGYLLLSYTFLSFDISTWHPFVRFVSGVWGMLSILAGIFITWFAIDDYRLHGEI